MFNTANIDDNTALSQISGSLAGDIMPSSPFR